MKVWWARSGLRRLKWFFWIERRGKVVPIQFGELPKKAQRAFYLMLAQQRKWGEK